MDKWQNNTYKRKRYGKKSKRKKNKQFFKITAGEA